VRRTHPEFALTCALEAQGKLSELIAGLKKLQDG